MDREEALDSIRANVENEDLAKHMLATEAIMRALARHFGEDEEEWGLAGLLHDIDVALPDKKLAGLESSSIVKRFEQKGFAAGAKREKVARCADIGLEFDEFSGLGLQPMKKIAARLGL